MSANLHVVTGATGQLGSHLVEKLAAQGEMVRAVVRPSSDLTFLKQLGVETVPVDWKDVASLRRAVNGAAFVYHSAAKVSDWGAWKQFQEETVDTTRNLVEACQAEKVGRFLHISSISVYGNTSPEDGLITEDAPLGKNLRWGDHYPRGKIEAEELVRKSSVPWTMVRPSWIYGPRDRVTIPRLIAGLRSQKVPIIGSGDNLLNIIYAGDVADGCLLASQSSQAVGQVFNLCSKGEVTQVEMLNTLTDALGLPRIQRHMPLGLLVPIAFLSEVVGRAIRIKRPPKITRRALYLVGRPPQFSIERARNMLGWQPRVPIKEGVRRALDWFFAQEDQKQSTSAR